MSDVRNESDHDGTAPLTVRLSITAAMTVGIGGGLLGLFYAVVGAFFGAFLVAGLAVCVSAGFAVAAVAMGKRSPHARSALTALTIVFIPGLPTFVSTYIKLRRRPRPGLVADFRRHRDSGRRPSLASGLKPVVHSFAFMRSRTSTIARGS